MVGHAAARAFGDPRSNNAFRTCSTTRRRQQIVDQIRAAGSILRLPQGIINDAIQLVPLLQQNYSAEENRVTAQTIAALLYYSARYAKHAIKLGQVAEPFSTYGLAVGSAYR